MSRPWTVQVGYNAHHCNTVTVEAATIEKALEKAVAAANEDAAGWRSSDQCSDSFCDAASEGAGVDPWGEGSLPVPARFSEHGEPPIVTLSGPGPAGRRAGLRRPGDGPLRDGGRHDRGGNARPAASAPKQAPGDGFRR
ncbi:MAG: hypothetical protein OXC15_05330, partial [Rhodospirillaceae bacterium]|nr:hypothetical protein [Rhodospirillaceae bacterium]